jgi:chondroitin 4-sulfotransferase 11
MKSDSLKTIFIHVPKTAGTSIKTSLGMKTSGTLMHKSATESSHLYSQEWNKYFTFSFVRNPWDRVVSIFFYYQTQRQRHKLPDNFNAFCSDLEVNLDILGHPGLKYTQKKYISIDNQIAVDYVGKVENLQNDFNIICERLGIEHRILPHIRKTNHKHYSEYYSEENRKKVAEVFREDIETFSYKF